MDLLKHRYKIGIMIFICLAFIFIFIIIMKNKKTINWINTPYSFGNYGNFNPKDRLYDLIKLYGKPDIIDRNSGGFALWKKQTLEKKGYCWDKVEIHDEQIPHEIPSPHVDFIYTWLKLDIPKNKINDVLALSESITYDPLKKSLRARCHFPGANTVTLLLAKRIAENKISLNEAKEAYGPYIFSTMQNHKLFDPNAEKNMEKELCN